MSLLHPHQPSQHLLHYKPLFPSTAWSWVTAGITSSQSKFQVRRLSALSEKRSRTRSNTPSTTSRLTSCLYRTSLPDDSKLEDTLRSFNFDEPLRATSILAKVFTDPPLEEHLHIVVQPPHEVLENAGIDEGYKDILMELYDSFNRTIMPMKKPPSEMAKSMQYIANQGGKSRILDCRCVDKGPATVVPPIQLFNPVFAYFTSRAFDPEHNVPSVFVRRIRTAVELFAQIHSSEASRQTSLRSILQDIISFPIFFASNADGTSADGVVFGSHGRTECTYLVVVEEKRELGDGWSDPSTQGAFSYLRTFCRPNNSTLLLKTCCPAFIVAHAGPWLNSWFLYTPPMMTTSGYALPVFFMCSRSLLDAYNHGMKTTWRRFTTLRILFPTLGSFPPSICSQRVILKSDFDTSNHWNLMIPVLHILRRPKRSVQGK